MLLLRTVEVERKSALWFVLNGVPIRYSLREHGLLTGFACHHYPNEMNPSMNLKEYKSKLKLEVFGQKKKVTMKDVWNKILTIGYCPNRLKLALVFFFSSVLACKGNIASHIDPFLWMMAEKPKRCKSFPWGRLTFENFVGTFYEAVKKMQGSAKVKWSCPGFIIPLEILPYECIPKLKMLCRDSVEGCEDTCPRMCKRMFKTSDRKGWSLEELYELVGSNKDIDSILVTENREEEETSRIILEQEEGIGGLDVIQDTWNVHLEANKKICWKELYDMDVASRSPIQKQAEKALPVQDLDAEKNPALVQFLKKFENRLRQELSGEFATKEEFKMKNKMLRRKVRLLTSKVRVLKSEVKSLRDCHEGAEYDYDYEYERDSNAGFGKQQLEKEPEGTVSAKEPEQTEKEKEPEEAEKESEEEKELEMEKEQEQMGMEKESEEGKEPEMEMGKESEEGKEPEMEMEKESEEEEEEEEMEKEIEEGVDKETKKAKETEEKAKESGKEEELNDEEQEKGIEFSLVVY
ncbi:hypothetical protein AALP_AA5G193600 [Arabis alpina]|nr:hypothetical protein AALP_AA5G193600 [Arabis alpina]